MRSTSADQFDLCDVGAECWPRASKEGHLLNVGGSSPTPDLSFGARQSYVPPYLDPRCHEAIYEIDVPSGL